MNIVLLMVLNPEIKNTEDIPLLILLWKLIEVEEIS